MDDARSFAPATLRNRDPILDILREVLPTSGLVLEVASGSGEHVMHFARHLPDLIWQPSDPSLAARQSIAAWLAADTLVNVRSPLDLDAAREGWPITRADAITCINMIHISPWAAAEGLMRGAAQILMSGSPLYLYGPYRRAERPLEPSNETFDHSLRTRNPSWGLRELDEVIACAAKHGLGFDRSIEMPANNLSLVFHRL